MKNTIESKDQIKTAENNNTSAKFNFFEYLNRKNIIIVLIAIIALTSWLKPKIMGQILSMLWAIIY